jgi:hypothetical protein
MGAPNPIAFRPLQVTFWTTVVYLALIIPLVVIHETVLPAPDPSHFDSGVSLAEAWSDLATLSQAYHPYQSRANDDVRAWLLKRLTEIKGQSGADDDSVVIFDDQVGNVTTAGLEGIPRALMGPDFKANTIGTYFEGNNIMVYIRGSDDPPGSWWEDPGSRSATAAVGNGGVLVNAHFDSVSTGYGATDDGMAVVTILQLVKHFSLPENQPHKGIVALLNNNEEDWLWGARAFGDHPLMPFCHVFLNLEGAAAGGKAILFRSTDAEVTSAYRGTPNPFGTVVGADAWKTGAIRSGTDYQIFYDIYGMRGLDVAFYRPRARYHTNQDDTRHTSQDSLWHMLSTALHTTRGLSSDTGNTFVGRRPDDDRRKVPNGAGTDGVWFDLFGQAFALFKLHSLFACSLTLLIVTPLALMFLTYILMRSDKYYFFSAKKTVYEEAVLEPVLLGGRKGIVRFPFALIVAGALTVASAYLVRKINPFAIYSYEYTVWAMMISLFFFVFWAIMAGANSIRPSALHRGYAIMWLFFISWGLLVVVTVFEDRFHIAAGYPIVFFQFAVFLSALLVLLELCGLPTKAAFAQSVHDEHDIRDFMNSDVPSHIDGVPHGESTNGSGPDNDGQYDDAEEPTETSPLVGRSNRSQDHTSTFGGVYRRSIGVIIDKSAAGEDPNRKAFGGEQLWSGRLPSWLWTFQFLLLGPFFLILFGQLGLVLVAAVKETGADGGSTLLPFLLMSIFSIVILLPVTPFIHRITHHIPMFLLVIFVGTLIFNLAVFPFSALSRYKIYWSQDIDLDTGVSVVHYMGAEEYVRQAMAQVPSAMGKEVTCEAKNTDRPDMAFCSYDGSGVEPKIAKDETPLESWITFNATRSSGSHKMQFTIDGLETRVCGVRFPQPVSRFQVVGGCPQDDRFGAAPEKGLDSIKLYRRDWYEPWTVDVEWEKETEVPASMDLEVYCNWSDANKQGTIPALEQALQFTPRWVAISKTNDALVQGRKSYSV